MISGVKIDAVLAFWVFQGFIVLWQCVFVLENIFVRYGGQVELPRIGADETHGYRDVVPPGRVPAPAVSSISFISVPEG